MGCCAINAWMADFERFWYTLKAVPAGSFVVAAEQIPLVEGLVLLPPNAL